ncbi:selenium cofactor biosynthesis protein YqeC [Dysosmobacter sp.]
MELAGLLGVRPGVTAVIGSGGKTTLLRTLGTALAAEGHRVLLCTTTKIYPFAKIQTLRSPTEEALAAALDRERLICAGTPLEGSGKLTAPQVPMARLAALAEYVLVEADGAAGRPLKAHAAHEPVIPAEAARVICVAGVSGFGLPIMETTHRPERFAQLAAASVQDSATPENTARVLRAESLAQQYFFNQADTPERWEWARRCGRELQCPSLMGALRKGVYGTCWL